MALADMNDLERNDLIVSLSALILGDAKAEVTADKLAAIAKASGNKADPELTASFTRSLTDRNVAKIIKKTGGQVGGGGGGGGAAAGGDAAAAVEEEEEEEEEVADGAVGGLFGDDDDDGY